MKLRCRVGNDNMASDIILCPSVEILTLHSYVIDWGGVRKTDNVTFRPSVEIRTLYSYVVDRGGDRKADDITFQDNNISSMCP